MSRRASMRGSLLLPAILFFGPVAVYSKEVQKPSPRSWADILASDPSTGFEQATLAFDTAKQKGDLDAMLEVVRVTAPVAVRCWHLGPLDRMVEAGAEAAFAEGRWEARAELYALGAEAHAQVWADWRGLNDHGPRMGRYADLAREAYDRAGIAPDRLEPPLKDVEGLRTVYGSVPTYWEMDA